MSSDPNSGGPPRGDEAAVTGDDPGLPADDDPTATEVAQPTPCAYADYVEGDAVEDLPATGEDATGLAADVWAVLRDVDDPEMPVSIVDLGLIYGVGVDAGEEGAAGRDRGSPAEAGAGARVRVAMTLTYTGCPARRYLTEEIEERVAAVDGVGSVDLELVWDPPWTLELVTDEGRERLREFGLSL